jgi:glycerophosphoryl diester phosphodiesterase
VQIVAHRGASREAPENTLLSLRRAWESGARWCEVDVQRTSDGVPILVHDSTWRRTAALDAAVRDTAWDTVQHLDVGSWFSTSTAGEAVPRLHEVLSWADRLCLNLEIKSPENDPGLADAVADAVVGAGLQQRTLLTCFDDRVIDALRQRQQGLQLGFLGRAPRRAVPGVGWQILEARALLDHPEWLRPSGPLAAQQVWAWTVDDLDAARKLVQRGVDGLITNDPGMLQPLSGRD